MAYATTSDVEDHGLALADDTDRISELLDRATEFIDRVTGQWFEKKTLTLKFDGDGTEVLDLPVPVIAVTSLGIISKLGTVASIIPAGNYIVYNRLRPDDRKDPHIYYANGILPEGFQNIEVIGDFGYVDVLDRTELFNNDYTKAIVPLDIKRVCILLVLREQQDLSDVNAQEDKKRGFLLKEETDGHSYELSPVMFRKGIITGDRAIDEILLSYRRFEVRPV